MVCYQSGKIYKLVNDVDDMEYIGSTCNPLRKRLYGHKKDALRKDRFVYNHLNAIGWDTVKIILIENYPSNSRSELTARERYHYDQLDRDRRLNMNRPAVTSEETKKQKQEYSQRPEVKERERIRCRDPRRTCRINKCVQCECGSIIGRNSRSSHRKSKKHLFWQQTYDFIHL